MNSGDIFAQARAMGLKTVRLVIHQPRAGGTREWTCSLDHLEAFAATARSKAASVEVAAREYERMKGSPETEAQWADTFINNTPNEDDCAYCKAMAVCPKAAARVEGEVTGGSPPSVDAFTDIVADSGALAKAQVCAADPDALASKMAAVGFIEDWCSAVRAEAERRLLSGGVVPGFGLELGRKGPRKWVDPNAAEEVIRGQFRLKLEDAFNFSLKSPTQMEALAPKFGKDGKVKPLKEGEAPPVLGPRQWAKLQPLITQADPKPSVKPSKAIKTPYQPAAADAFSAVEAAPPPADDSLG